MRLENLISELAAHDTVSVAGGEVQFGKCLKEVIGGVPIYDIWALRTGECAERVVFANFEEIDDFLLESDSSFRICSHCQEFAGDMGYYIDNETGNEFCSLNCLTSYLNELYGKDNWSTMVGKEDFFNIYIAVPEEQEQYYDNLKKVNGRYWRKYDITYVSAYKDLKDVDWLEDDEEDIIL